MPVFRRYFSLATLCATALAANFATAADFTDDVGIHGIEFLWMEKGGTTMQTFTDSNIFEFDENNDLIAADLQMVIVGDKRFFDFEILSSNSTVPGSTPVTLDDIAISGIQSMAGDFGIQIGISGFSAFSTFSEDFLFRYRVQVLDPVLAIESAIHDLNGGNATGNGIANISEQIRKADNVTPLADLLVFDVPAPGTPQFVDSSPLSMLATELVVTKDFSVEGNGGFATISGNAQLFPQAVIPEPAHYGMAGFGLLALTILGRRFFGPRR